jgi:hypothetical protein
VKFWSSFFKSLRGGGRVALLAPRKGRNTLFGVSFCGELASLLFSLRLFPAKKKWSNDFVLYNELSFFNMVCQ